MAHRKKVALVPNAVFSAPFAISVLHVYTAHKNESRRISCFFQRKRSFEHLFSCTAIVFIEISPRIDQKECIHFTGCSYKVPRRLSIADSKIAGLRLRPGAPPCQQKSFGNFEKTARRQIISVQIQHRRRLGKPKSLCQLRATGLYTRLPSCSKCSIISFAVDTHEALPGSWSFPIVIRLSH